MTVQLFQLLFIDFLFQDQMKQNQTQSKNNSIIHKKQSSSLEQQSRDQVLSQQMSSKIDHNKKRIPLVLKQNIKKYALLEPSLLIQIEDLPSDSTFKIQEKSIDKQSKKYELDLVIKRQLRRLITKRTCQICQKEFKITQKTQKIGKCEHKKNICESCLHHYVIYKVNSFQQVYCPNENCNHKLDTSLPFFSQLPLQIQQKYRKIKRFQQTIKDPNIRLCPKQKCQGYIKTTTQKLMKCQVCQAQFCRNCLLQAHQDTCDQYQLRHFQSSMHYRQCKRCRFMIEKNQGCDHMTCRCGYQFCYVCGQEWTQSHSHMPQNQIINNNYSFILGSQCECLENSPYIAYLIKFLIRLFASFFHLSFIMPLMLGFYTIIFILLLVISFLFGWFRLLCYLIGKDKKMLFVLGIILFPITVIVGIGYWIKQVVCQMSGQISQKMFQSFCGNLLKIWRT